MPTPGDGGADEPAVPPPPQMPGAPQTSAYVPQPQMPADAAPSWDPSDASGPPAPGSGDDSAPPVTEAAPADEPTPAPDVAAPLPRSHQAEPSPAPEQSAPADAPPVAPLPGDATAADDWLGKICPYLISADGSYRSTQPDENHRCSAQEPNGNLPLAFQERFCLTDGYVRCEMYKYAQETRAAGLDDGGVSSEQVQSARFKPSVRSVPVASTATTADAAGGEDRRELIIGGAALGGLILVVLVTLLFSGGSSDGGDTVADAGGSPATDATAAAQATDEPAPDPTPEPDGTPTGDDTPETSEAAGAGPQLIEYEVQEGEALLKIAENFGTSRRKIINANEGMADRTPYVQPGDAIIVPAAAEMTVEELESFPGYLGPVL